MSTNRLCTHIQHAAAMLITVCCIGNPHSSYSLHTKACNENASCCMRKSKKTARPITLVNQTSTMVYVACYAFQGARLSPIVAVPRQASSTINRPAVHTGHKLVMIGAQQLDKLPLQHTLKTLSYAILGVQTHSIIFQMRGSILSAIVHSKDT